METARKILIEAFAQLSFHLERKNPPSLLVTHDVDTERGLRRASALKDIEDDLNVSSIWFVVSNEYPIDRSIAARLAENSVIGSHDIKHDGKLLRIRKRPELVQRMRESRQKLGRGFRTRNQMLPSPPATVQQRNHFCLKRGRVQVLIIHFHAGKLVYPPTMSGFGIECAQAFEMEGIVETPLTLFQDHQVLNLMDMNVDEAIKLWLEQARLIRSFEGDIVLLIHPDYSFSNDLKRYRELLTKLLEIHVEAAFSASATSA